MTTSDIVVYTELCGFKIHHWHTESIAVYVPTALSHWTRGVYEFRCPGVIDGLDDLSSELYKNFLVESYQEHLRAIG